LTVQTLICAAPGSVCDTALVADPEIAQEGLRSGAQGTTSGWTVASRVSGFRAKRISAGSVY